MLVWRQHPTEIEAELLTAGLDIADWHAGRMSSRRLLVLLRHAKETGPYKTALREGRYPEFLRMLAEIHKELALYRASKYVGGEHEYTPKVFVDPHEAAERAEQAEQDEQDFEESQDGLYEMVGWKTGPTAAPAAATTA